MGETQAPAALIRSIYGKLLRRFGPQHWWPGDTPFEVAVGAVLTQSTAWTNAHRAVLELRGRGLLHPARLSRVPRRRLAGWIRSSGYFNQKADRLLALSRFIQRRYGGSMARMRRVPASRLREEFLAIPGIGPETADSILLYALEKPAFVVDAYTRRVLARHSLIRWDAAYGEIQDLFLEALPKSPKLFNEYHALFVALGKGFCRRTRPRCEGCPLQGVGRLVLETR